MSNDPRVTALADFLSREFGGNRDERLSVARRALLVIDAEDTVRIASPLLKRLRAVEVLGVRREASR